MRHPNTGHKILQTIIINAFYVDKRVPVVIFETIIRSKISEKYHLAYSSGGKDEKFKSKNVFYVPDGLSGGLFYCFTGGRSEIVLYQLGGS